MVFRGKKLQKKLHALKTRRHLLRDSRVRWIAALTLLLVFLVAAIHSVESASNERFRSVWDSIYWAVVTLATVGYGDITPQGSAGRLLAIPFIITGVVLMSYMTATIASILTATRIREGRGLQKISLQRHVVVCGSNTHIFRVIGGIISSAGRAVPDIVLINTRSESENIALIDRFPETNIRFVNGDYTVEATLRRAAVDKAAAVIILSDPGQEGTARPDDRTLIASLAIRSLSRQVEICAELLDSANEVHLRRAGVDQMVFSGEFSGFLLSSSVMTPGITQALREIMRTDRGGCIQRRDFPREMVGRTFHEAVREYMDLEGVILLGVITERKTFNMEDLLRGDNSTIDDFIRRTFEEAGRSLEVEAKGRLTVSINPGKDYRITENDNAVVLSPSRKEEPA